MRICWVMPGRRRVEVERLKFLNTAAISGIGQMAIDKALVPDGWDRLLRDVSQGIRSNLPVVVRLSMAVWAAAASSSPYSPLIRTRN